jgi:hypothetical protein
VLAARGLFLRPALENAVSASCRAMRTYRPAAKGEHTGSRRGGGTAPAEPDREPRRVDAERLRGDKMSELVNEDHETEDKDWSQDR